MGTREFQRNGEEWSLTTVFEHPQIIVRHEGTTIAYIQGHRSNLEGAMFYADASTCMHTLPGFVVDEMREMDQVRVPAYD